MPTGSLKLQLIERLLRTQDEDLLNKVADLFRSEEVVEEEDGRRALQHREGALRGI